MKDKIYELICKGKVAEYDIKKIAAVLKLNSTGDFVLLNKFLNELEDEFLIVRNSKNFYLLPKQENIFKGIISINSKGTGYLDLEEYSIIIKNKDLNGALDKDEVIVKISKKSLNSGKVIQIVKRNTTNIVGTLFFNKKKIKVNLDNEKFKYLKTDVLNSRKFKIVDGLKAVFKIVKFNTEHNIIKVNIEQIIGHKDDPGVDILSILLQKDIEPMFSKEVMDEANSISQKVLPNMKKGRIDLCKDTIITIDGDDSKDFDDAISIKKENSYYLLGVHIADVSYYVNENSWLDKEARHRGTSVYVVDRVVPMLPHILSNGICSLNPEVERLTISVNMKVDFEGEVFDYDIFPSVIKSKYRMTYKNVNKMLNSDKATCEKYSSIYSMILDMKECADLIRNKREENGSINFDRDEILIKVDSSGKPTDILKRERGESERIIEDFMICANEIVARHLRYQNIPTLYRVHEPILSKKLLDFKRISSLMGKPFKMNNKTVTPKDVQKYLNGIKDYDEYPIISTLMLRSMQKARYDFKPIGHFGLALDDYLHFTSPIRRYPDLIVHRMLRKYCFNNDFTKTSQYEKLMGDMAIETSNRERLSIEAEREVNDLKTAEYMSYHIGEVFDGIISSITKFGFFVELDNLIEGLVHIETLQDDYYNFDESTLSLRGEKTGKRFILGQKVKVRLVKASKVLKTIDFVIYKDKKQKLSRWR